MRCSASNESQTHSASGREGSKSAEGQNKPPKIKTPAGKPSPGWAQTSLKNPQLNFFIYFYFLCLLTLLQVEVVIIIYWYTNPGWLWGCLKFISMPTLPLQNNTALETTLKSFLCCFPVLFFLLLLNFRTLPVGSKSWVLLQRSTFCFLSAGDSLLRMLPCLGHRKTQNPQPRAQGSCLSPHTNLTQLCLPTRNSD